MGFAALNPSYAARTDTASVPRPPGPRVDDAGGSPRAAADRVAALAEQISTDGEVIHTPGSSKYR